MIINKEILLYSLLAGLAFVASNSWAMEEDKTKEQQSIERVLTTVKRLEDTLQILNKRMPVPFNQGSFHADRQRNVGAVSSFGPNQHNVYNNTEKEPLNELEK